MHLSSARLSDFHACPLINPGPVPHVGGPIATGMPSVLIGGLPAARVGDVATCAAVPPNAIATGSVSVFVGDRNAARNSELTLHGGQIVGGCSTLLIGDFSSPGSPDPILGLSHQANALLMAAVSKSPFCEVCEEAAQSDLDERKLVLEKDGE